MTNTRKEATKIREIQRSRLCRALTLPWEGWIMTLKASRVGARLDDVSVVRNTCCLCRGPKLMAARNSSYRETPLPLVITAVT